MPQLERCSEWGKISFWKGLKFFGLVYSSPSFLLISKKEKRLSHQIGLLFSEFPVDFQSKAPPSSNSRKGKGSLDGHSGKFRGAEFLFRGGLLLPPP